MACNAVNVFWYMNFVFGIGYLAQFVTYLVLVFQKHYNVWYPVTFTIQNQLLGYNTTLNSGTPGFNSTVYETHLYFKAYPLAGVSAVFFFASFFFLVRLFMTDWRSNLGKVNAKGMSEKKMARMQSVNAYMSDRKLRNWEFIFSGTVMLSVIFIVSGVSDFLTLMAISACNISTIWFFISADMIETSTPGPSDCLKKSKWWSFSYGIVVGLVPWICLFWNMAMNNLYTPALTYGVTFCAFVFWLISVILESYFNSLDETADGSTKDVGSKKMVVEFVHSLLSFCSKTMFGIMVTMLILNVVQ